MLPPAPNTTITAQNRRQHCQLNQYSQLNRLNRVPKLQMKEECLWDSVLQVDLQQ